MRVQVLKNYVKENFPATPVLDYALAVEKITTSKVNKLLLPISSVLFLICILLLLTIGWYRILT